MRLYYGPDTHADPILIGCLAGALFVAGKAPAINRFVGPVILMGVVIAPLSVIFTVASLWRTAYALACGLLILASIESGLTATLLARKPLVFLGRISYSLYLWHVPIFAAAGVGVVEGLTVRSIAACCAAGVIATASFYLVEQPLRRRWRERRPETSFPSTAQPSAASP